ERARDAQPSQNVRRHPGDIAAVERHRAGVGWQRAGDEIECGALAGAVRPDDRGDAVALALEAQIVDGAQAAKGLVEISDLDHGPTFRRAVPRRTRPHKPSGKNMTKTMKMMPSTNRWRSV